MQVLDQKEKSLKLVKIQDVLTVQFNNPGSDVKIRRSINLLSYSNLCDMLFLPNCKTNLLSY